MLQDLESSYVACRNSYTNRAGPCTVIRETIDVVLKSIDAYNTFTTFHSAVKISARLTTTTAEDF